VCWRRQARDNPLTKSPYILFSCNSTRAAGLGASDITTRFDCASAHALAHRPPPRVTFVGSLARKLALTDSTLAHAEDAAGAPPVVHVVLFACF
jgi:hypothetical protein